jgi:hypothetical protein
LPLAPPFSPGSTKKGNGPGFFEFSLKRFLPIHLGEAQDKGFELSEPKGQVFKAPGASLRLDQKPV